MEDDGTALDLSNWAGCKQPGTKPLTGQHGILVPYSEDTHLSGLFDAVCGDENDNLWEHIPLGPFGTSAEFAAALGYTEKHLGWKTMVIENGGAILGMASYMRIRPEHGSAEVGCVVFGPTLKRTRTATEAIFLMAQHVFDGLGYRRFEWKCNNANEASKRAAVRFGFRFEGVFRNDMVLKGRSRDTAWYAMTDADWTRISPQFRAWLAPDNFDDDGSQRSQLRAGKAFA